MKKLSRKNVLRNEIPGQMSIEDFPEYLPESYSRGGMRTFRNIYRKVIAGGANEQGRGKAPKARK